MSTSKFSSLCTQSISFNENNDCTVKAMAVVTGLPYAICHEALRRRGRKNRKGAYPHQYHSALKDLGFHVEKIRVDPRAKTMKTVTKYLPTTGKFLINVSRHVAGATGRLIHDWADGTQRRIKSVHAVTKFEDVNLAIFDVNHDPSKPVSFKMKPTQKDLMFAMVRHGKNGFTLRHWAEVAGVSYGSLTRFVGARNDRKRKENDAKYGFKSLVSLGKVKLVDGKYYKA